MILRMWELGLVCVTAAVFLALPKPPDLVWPMALFIPCAIVGWIGFGWMRIRGDRTLVERWGLEPGRNIVPMTAFLAPLFAILVGIGATIAVAWGRPLVPAYLWLSLLLYPLWGGVQQWLVQALCIDNIAVLTKIAPRWQILLGGIGFGAIHIAEPGLLVATALMGGVYVWLFRRWRNLWPLAACHGWLGSLFYPWILGRNPIAELIGWIG